MKNRRLCRGQNIKTNSMKKIIALLLFAQSLFAQEKPINELLDKTSPAYGGATSVLDVGQMMGESFLIEKFQYFQSNPEDNIILYGSLLPQIKNGCYQTSAFIRVNKNLSVGFCAYICPDDKKAEVAIVKKTGGDNYECEYSKREKRRIQSDDNQFFEILDFDDGSKVIIKDKIYIHSFLSSCINEKRIFVFQNEYYFTSEK
jgi:hypothetical protein